MDFIKHKLALGQLNDRLEFLNRKLEREGLTENEWAEIKLYYSQKLAILRELNLAMSDITAKFYDDLKN